MRAVTSSTGFRSTFVFAFLASLGAACGSGVVGTGQSLAVGGYGSEATNAPSFNNLKVGLGVLDVSTFDPTMADPASTELTMVALSEPTRSSPGGYPSAYQRSALSRGGPQERVTR